MSETTRTCAACGAPVQGGMSIGGTLLCRDHAEDVRTEIDKIRAEGGRPNAAGIARRMYRETYSAGNYLLRDVPKELMDAIKADSFAKGIDARAWMLDTFRAALGR